MNDIAARLGQEGLPAPIAELAALCGAVPRPAGSVISLNGRNAAAAVLGRPAA